MQCGGDHGALWVNGSVPKSGLLIKNAHTKNKSVFLKNTLILKFIGNITTPLKMTKAEKVYFQFLL